MLHINIIQVGKTKDSYFKEAENEYLKRLSRYAKISVETIEEDKKGDDKIKAIEKEGESIIKKIRDDAFVVALEIGGKSYSSEEFASFLKESGKITFVIGGPYGLSDKVLSRADARLSFSKMTFTHQMIRVILLEQVYRGCTILEGKKYHY
ncbi:23S rRNA (pseudouridine(1915)-N(3))-methyltransferase RlmH [Patescibacteria group bacterium]